MDDNKDQIAIINPEIPLIDKPPHPEIEQLQNTASSPEQTSTSQIYPLPTSQMGLNEYPDSGTITNDNEPQGKNLVVKVILIALGLVVVFIVIGVIGVYADDARAKKDYEAAIERCGHNPIVYDLEKGNLFGAPNSSLELASVLDTGPGNKYYCTLTEARADGYSQAQIDNVREEINDSDDIPASIKSEYR